MRPHPSTVVLSGLILMLGMSLFAAAGISGHGVFSRAEPAGTFQEDQEAGSSAAEPEKVHGAPSDIREAAAIYVFLGWLWLSILVLIYLLRLKIRECDRLDHFDYFQTSGKPEPGP